LCRICWQRGSTQVSDLHAPKCALKQDPTMSFIVHMRLTDVATEHGARDCRSWALIKGNSSGRLLDAHLRTLLQLRVHPS
jgi:hypothetical protein